MSKAFFLVEEFLLFDLQIPSNCWLTYVDMPKLWVNRLHVWLVEVPLTPLPAGPAGPAGLLLLGGPLDSL
jgi:hypothetical protein